MNAPSLVFTTTLIRNELLMIQDAFDDLIKPCPSDVVAITSDMIDSDVDDMIDQLSADYEFYNQSSDVVKYIIAANLFLSNIDLTCKVTIDEVMTTLRGHGFHAFIESLSDYYPVFLFSSSQ